MYNRAIADGIFEPKDNPFSRFKVGRYWKPTRKRAINKEDVLKLKELELSEDSSFYLEFARDIFLFSYYNDDDAIYNDDVLEWWLVTAPFARLLKAENEIILEDLGCFWWGRQCSGQAIFMDSVITDIVKGFN